MGTVQADFSMECGSDEHVGWAIMLGVPLLTFYAIGIPMLGLGLLCYAHSKGIEEWRNVLGFLFNGFKPNLFYWEIVIMVRKLFFAVISVVFRPIGADIQAYTGIGVLTVAMSLQIKLQPYESGEMNQMELLALFTSFSTLYCGLFLFTPNTSELFREFCSVAVVLANIGFLAFVLWKLRVYAKNAGASLLERQESILYSPQACRSNASRAHRHTLHHDPPS